MELKCQHWWGGPLPAEPFPLMQGSYMKKPAFISEKSPWLACAAWPNQSQTGRQLVQQCKKSNINVENKATGRSRARRKIGTASLVLVCLFYGGHFTPTLTIHQALSVCAYSCFYILFLKKVLVSWEQATSLECLNHSPERIRYMPSFGISRPHIWEG